MVGCLLWVLAVGGAARGFEWMAVALAVVQSLLAQWAVPYRQGGILAETGVRFPGHKQRTRRGGRSC